MSIYGDEKIRRKPARSSSCLVRVPHPGNNYSHFEQILYSMIQGQVPVPNQ
jgi:hypothetical protein